MRSSRFSLGCTAGLLVSPVSDSGCRTDLHLHCAFQEYNHVSAAGMSCIDHAKPHLDRQHRLTFKNRIPPIAWLRFIGRMVGRWQDSNDRLLESTTVRGAASQSLLFFNGSQMRQHLSLRHSNTSLSMWAPLLAACLFRRPPCLATRKRLSCTAPVFRSRYPRSAACRQWQRPEK